jgi:ubiquinone/menaquinone biosynthesis C-methylase UbiE
MENPLERIAREFSKAYPVMNDADRRRRRGLKASSILKEVLQGKEIQHILDVGCSNAIFLDVVIEELKANFGLGVDLDADALPKPAPHRVGVVGNALALPVSDASIDLILCNHTYEHVSDAKKLLEEIRRVLRPNGIVYFGAMNSRWPIEPHYHIPFIHWLSKNWSAAIMKRFGYQTGYLEQPLNTPKLRQLVCDFDLYDYTLKVIARPKQYRADDIIYPKLAWAFYPIAKLLYGYLPGYIWVLVKRPDSEVQ